MIVRFEKPEKTCTKYRKLVGTAILLLKVCVLPIAMYLAWKSFCLSYYPLAEPSWKVYETRLMELPDSMGVHLLVFLGICAVAVGILKGLDMISGAGSGKQFSLDKEKVCRGMLFLACVWLAVIGYLYIRNHPYYPIGDQINTTAAASYAKDGTFDMFIKGGYIGMYRQQEGLVFLYEILFRIFGDFCYDVAARFHLLFLLITVIAGYSFLKIVAQAPLYRILYCLMMMFCIPYILYLPYIYGDLPSICFSMVLFWALAAYGREFRKRYLLAASIAAALALLVRKNIWIVLIAVAIGMVLLALEKEKIYPAVAGLCIILSAGVSVGMVAKLYEYRSGFEDDGGIPSILWLAMGLQETDETPGVYNRYQQSVFEECGFEREPAVQIGKEYISSRIEEFRENPAYAKYFFARKIQIQWLEPLFGSLGETSYNREEREAPEWIAELYYGKIHNLVWKCANYYQSIIYFSLLAFVLLGLFMKKAAPLGSTAWIPMIAVVGGFLFGIFWENKCRYMLPYFMYLVVYAPLGVGKLAETASGLISRYLGQSVRRTGKKSDDMAA